MKKHSFNHPGWLIGGLLFLLTIIAAAHAQQQPPIDASVFDKWPSLETANISNDGNYGLYAIRNKPVRSRTLVIRATKGNWKVEVGAAGEAAITQDSRKVVFIKPKDTLCLLTLGTSSTECIPDVKFFRLIKQGTDELLVYQLNGPANELVVRDLGTGRKTSFDAVAGYSFSGDGKVLLLQKESKNQTANAQSLDWVNLVDGKTSTIWQGTKAYGFIFDIGNTQLAFIVEDKVEKQTGKSLWYYKAGTEQAVVLADNQKGSPDDVKFDAVQRFSRDGSRLFIYLKEKNRPAAEADSVKVDVWSYKDSKLQSQQLHELDPTSRDRGPRSYAAVIAVLDRRVIRLEQENDRMPFNFDNPKQDLGLVINTKGDAGNEWNWNRAALATIYLVSTVNGTRKLLAEKVAGRVANSYVLSPEGKYIIWYNPDEKNYFAYTVSAGVVRNITKGISGGWGTYDRIDEPKPSSGMIRGLAGWLKDDAAVLIYGQHDVFRVDLSEQVPPINLTNGYGEKHNVEFKIIRYSAYSGDAISENERLILSAFNRTNKNSGFYATTLGKNADPELLTMQPYLFGPYEQDNPKKARDAEVYLVRRMSTEESPNYFSTTDFKTFTPLTDLHPERAYNWLRSELVTWKTLDGNVSQGVIYKPDDFDPTKKYPVIFTYYERLSDEMHEFKDPEASIGPMNIPFFVSNGYVVFTPDIHYTIGYPGKSAFNSIVSAAKYLSKMPWVDATKMGLQGHSFGGFETLYVITHTNMFAAAMASSPMSNFISAYGSIIGDGSSRQRQYELYRNRIGTTLWERPDLYIENSPVLRADKVTTPLLMMSNKGDGDVPFPQGVEMFTALRRLGKKAWMLQYDGEDHLVFDKAAGDLTIRMKQFFDHYLKGAPPPKWMTEGVPARLKGVESGLELDKSGKKP